MKTRPACLLGSPDEVLATPEEFLKEAREEMKKDPSVEMYMNYYRLASQCDDWDAETKRDVRNKVTEFFRKLV
jgi:hypothetical protein